MKHALLLHSKSVHNRSCSCNSNTTTNKNSAENERGHNKRNWEERKTTVCFFLLRFTYEWSQESSPSLADGLSGHVVFYLLFQCSVQSTGEQRQWLFDGDRLRNTTIHNAKERRGDKNSNKVCNPKHNMKHISHFKHTEPLLSPAFAFTPPIVEGVR